MPQKGDFMLEKYDDVITVDDLCKILHIGKKLAYRLIKDGTIPARQLGRVYRIPKTAVEKYLLMQG